LAGWHVFSLFHTLVFTPASIDMFRDEISYKQHIIRNAERVRVGDWALLLTEANLAEAAYAELTAQRRARRSPAGRNEPEARLHDRLLRLVLSGKLGRAMDALRSAYHKAVAPSGEALLLEMRTKHPPAKAPIPMLPADPVRFNLSFASFQAAVRGLKDDKSPGADGFSDGLLRDCLSVSTPEGHFCMDAAFLIASIVASGRCPPEVGRVLMICELRGIPKKVGEGEAPAARPIGLNGNLRKLIFGAYLLQVKERIAAHFAPFQYGSAPGGVDAAILTSRRAAFAVPNSPTALLDLYNAWNEGIRAAMLAALLDSPFSDLAPMFAVTYGQENILLLKHPDFPNGYEAIASCEGSTQGCKLAALLFCILTMPIIRRIFGPGGPFHLLILCLFYADDAKLRCIGPDRRLHFSQMTACISLLGSELAAVGFRLVASKSFLALLTDVPGAPTSALPARNRMTDAEWQLHWPHVEGVALRLEVGGFKYLGAPFASATAAGQVFLSAFFGAITARMREEMQMIKETFSDPGVVWRLLTCCIITQFSFLLRCSAPTDALMEAARSVDDDASALFVSSLRLAGVCSLADLASLLLPSPTGPTVLPASLLRAIAFQLHAPVGRGGLGITSMLHSFFAASVSVLRSYAGTTSAHLAFHRVAIPPQGDYLTLAYQSVRRLSASVPHSPATPPTLALVGLSAQSDLQFAHDSAVLGAVLELVRADASVAYSVYGLPIQQGRQQAARLISLSFQTTLSSHGWLERWWTLPANIFAISCLLRLGIPTSSSTLLPSRNICGGVITCSAHLDLFLFHLWSCVTGARQDLHHSVAQWLASYIESRAGHAITVEYEKPGLVRGNQTRPGDIVLHGSFPWLFDSAGLIVMALVADLKVIHPCGKSYAIVGMADRVGGAATRIGADQKRRDFANKIRGDPRGVQMHKPWSFRPWIITAFGDMNAEMADDLEGIAAILARHRMRGRWSEEEIQRAARAELRELLSALSCELQRLVFMFLDARLRACN